MTPVGTTGHIEPTCSEEVAPFEIALPKRVLHLKAWTSHQMERQTLTQETGMQSFQIDILVETPQYGQP